MLDSFAEIINSKHDRNSLMTKINVAHMERKEVE